MKIGIFTSGLENLSLLKLLKQYNLDIIVYINQNVRPLEDKSLKYQENAVKQGIDFLLSKNVDKIILHPLWELKFLGEDFILPFYKGVIDQTFKYSVVGKIGLFGNELDLNEVEKFLIDYVKTYNPTERQSKIKAFNCWRFYKKEISIWKYNTIVLGKRNWMLRKLIKTDLRYFFDANVDSILPTTYDIYHFDHIINQKKKKLHFQRLFDLEFVDVLFGPKQNKYSLKIYGNGNVNMFLKHKRWQVFLK